MKHCTLLGILLLSLAAGPAWAHGFGLYHRPTEVRYSYYYYPSTVYYYPAAPVYYYVRPAPVVQPYYPAAPVMAPVVQQYAVPVAAPASTTLEPPILPSRPSGGGATSMRVGESFYEVKPGPVTTGREGTDGRVSVGFWNLTSQPLTVRVEGRDLPLSPGRTVMVDLPATFAWRIVGREGEATTIPAGRTSAEILIRR
jgi:hypothetical protein